MTAFEDVTAIVTTVAEIHDDLKWLKHDGKWLKRAVQVLIDHDGLTVEPDADDLEQDV